MFVNQQARMSWSHGDQPPRMSLRLCMYFSWHGRVWVYADHLTKISLKLCRSACMNEFEFMWINRHRRVTVEFMWISRNRSVGIYVDQQEWMSLSSCGSADTEELGFIWISWHRRVGVHVDHQIQKNWNYVDQHGHQPSTMSLSLCR